jgi:hypothetical protein
LSIGCLEFGDISLICLEFLRSTTSERQYIDREYYVLLAFEIAKFVSLPVSGAQREVRRRITNLQVSFDGRRLLGQCDNAKHGKQHNAY